MHAEPLDGDNEEPLSSESRLIHHVRAVYRRRWIALTMFVAVATVAAVRTFTTVPIYEASSQLLIEADQPNVLTFEDVVRQDRPSANSAETQYRLLRSRGLARRTLTALDLWERPPFGGAQAMDGAASTFSLRQAVGVPVRWAMQRLRPEPPDFEPAGSDEGEAESAAIDRLLGDVTIAPIRNSQMVDVKYRSPDPRLAARVANEIVRQYIAQSEDVRLQVSQNASGWLAKQLAEQRQQLEASEQALQRYREQNDAVSLENPQNIVVQKLADLNAAVTKAKMERIEKESQYNQLLDLQRGRGDLDSFPAILSNTYIQQLKTDLAGLQAEREQAKGRFGAKHPTMVKLESGIASAQAKLDAEVAKVVQSVGNEFTAAQAQERSLTDALNTQKATALAQNRKEIDTGSCSARWPPTVSCTTHCCSGRRKRAFPVICRRRTCESWTRRRCRAGPCCRSMAAILLLGLLAGGVLAVGGALFLEHLDNRIKTPDEIAMHLGLSCLGLVPRIAIKGAHAPLINNGVPPNFTEALKGVRTSVQFSSAEEGSRSLVVTSTGPGEGKTVVSTNLAIALAQTGARVILVDADMRRPSVHQLFGRRQEPGLSNLLVGDAKPSQAVRASAVSGLWVVPAGRIPPNPAELLGSTRFKLFLAKLREQFDWVILDSPPVMTVTDASVVAHSANGVIFVVGSEMTHRGAARTAVGQLLTADAKLVGAVLNRVNLDRDRYYYADYYRREYAQYDAAVS